MPNFWGYTAPLIVDILTFMTLALSLNLINGCAGMFSLGHQGFFGVGAYTAGIVVVYAGLPAAIALPTAILAGGLAAAIFGLIVGIPCLRLKGDYLAIATLGFAEIFRIAMVNLDAVGGPRGFNMGSGIPFARTLQSRPAYYGLYLGIAASLVVVTYVVIRNIMKSSHGRAIYAIREDEIAAELLGVDLTRYKVTVFAIGAGFAGLAGGVFAGKNLYITPNDFSLMFGVVLLLYVVLGGLGSLGGCIIATLFLFVLERVLALSQSVIGTWWQVVFALLLILIVLIRPQGLLGKRAV
jgi:branched-chain amino acid transport system permease protein